MPPLGVKFLSICTKNQKNLVDLPQQFLGSPQQISAYATAHGAYFCDGSMLLAIDNLSDRLLVSNPFDCNREQQYLPLVIQAVTSTKNSKINYFFFS